MAAITRRPDGAAASSEPLPFLLRLYPAQWRARYGDEFRELLESRPPNLRDRLDIVVGAIDARVNPQVRGAADREVRVPGDGSIRALAGATGALLTIWGFIGVMNMRPWNSADWQGDPALFSLAYVAGLLGAFTGLTTLVLIALRYDRAIGSSGALGALGAGIGLVLASFGGGALALVLLGVGVGPLAWRLRGRMLDTATAVIYAGTTFAVIVGFLAFAAGGGQDTRILWGVAAYGPAWLLLGLRLRAPTAPALVGA